MKRAEQECVNQELIQPLGDSMSEGASSDGRLLRTPTPADVKQTHKHKSNGRIHNERAHKGRNTRREQKTQASDGEAAEHTHDKLERCFEDAVIISAHETSAVRKKLYVCNL